MLKHVLLLLFTFGSWQFIWIYRTTEFLNRTPNEPPRSGVSQLLLCMFVPFYIIYWVYASCKRIDKLAYYNGIQGEITVMCVLFEIFIAILAPILMQDKLNNIVTFRNIPPAGVDPAYQQAQQAAWQQAQAQAQTYQELSDFEAIAIVCEEGEAWPCGICRQFMKEFCDDDFKIITGDDEESLRVYTMEEILPEGFRL